MTNGTHSAPKPLDELPPPPLGMPPFPVDTGNAPLLDDEAGVSNAQTLDMPSSRSNALTGEFGRYTILRRLGKGGMGTVYLALDNELDRHVALKVPHPSIAADPHALQRFQNEARAAATLDHPNICAVYDVGQIKATNFLTMAYVEGRTLGELLRDNDEPLAAEAVADLIFKLALALAEAHSRGVVHRDLKPANIMVNKRWMPVIMDFGLAHRQYSEDVRLTASGSIMGTPAYMSPEQVSGDPENIGPASDVYSLGIIMYEMLTGRLPFEGSTGEILAKIATEPPPPLEECQPDIDPALAAICMRALEKDTADRYASMTDFANDLKDFLQSGEGSVIPSAAATQSNIDQSSNGRKKESSVHLAAQLLEDLAARIDSGEFGDPTQLHSARSNRYWWAFVALAPVLILIVLFSVQQGSTESVVAMQIDVRNFNNIVNVVFILDGRKVSRKELAGKLKLAVGQHELVVRKDGRVIAQRKFEVSPDSHKVGPILVEPAPGPSSDTTKPNNRNPSDSAAKNGAAVTAPSPKGSKAAAVPTPPEKRPEQKLSDFLKSVKIPTTLSVWTMVRYDRSESPFFTEVQVNGQSIGTFNTRARASIAREFRAGWNRIDLVTRPKPVPSKSGEGLVVRFGTLKKTGKAKYDARVLWRFYPAERWKLKDGRYQHQLDPKATEMKLTAHVYFAGLSHEKRQPKEGDILLQSGAKWDGNYNSTLTATVFVNGLPLTTFGQENRRAVVTEYLRQGENEIKLVTHPIDNQLEANDVRIRLSGPATYNTAARGLTYRPIAWLSAWTGWRRTKTKMRMVPIHDPKKEKIERRITFHIPTSRSRKAKVVAAASRKWDYLENSLHSDVIINGQKIGRFTSDTWEAASPALKKNAWNEVELITESMQPGHLENYLRFSFRPVLTDGSGEAKSGAAIWRFGNGQAWKARDNRLFHRSGKDVTKTSLKFHLFLGDSQLEQQKLEEGDYVLYGAPKWSYYLPSVTATVAVNGKMLTTCAGLSRTFVLKSSVLKKGKNEIKLITKRVDNCYKSNDYLFTVSGPAKYSVAKAKIVPQKVVAKFSALEGWKRDKDLQLVNESNSDTLQRSITFQAD